MIILIGSRAARMWYPKYWPKPKDTDFIATFMEMGEWINKHKDLIKGYWSFDKGKRYCVLFHNGAIVEIEIAYPGSSTAELARLITEDLDKNISFTIQMGDRLIPSMDWLFTIKASHRHQRSQYMEKTIRDCNLMASLGYKIANKEWFKMRAASNYLRKRPRILDTKSGVLQRDYPNWLGDARAEKTVKRLDSHALAS